MDLQRGRRVNPLKIRAWQFINNRWIKVDNYFHLEHCLKNPEIEIEVFIGLCDKNGKEIYQGDILATSSTDPTCDLWNKEDHGYTIVYWNNIYSRFVGDKWTWVAPDPNEPQESIFCLEFIEVIGNIKQNPELVKKV